MKNKAGEGRELMNLIYILATQSNASAISKTIHQTTRDTSITSISLSPSSVRKNAEN